MDTLRTEEIAAKALKRVNDDRYVLASLIFERVKELGEGAKPLIDENIKNYSLNFIRGAETLKIVSKRLETRDIEKINKIEGLKGKLRNYQLTGVNYLLSLSEMNFGGICGAERANDEYRDSRIKTR